MNSDRQNFPITPERFDAVLFDLDGVLTATAKVHAVAWKKTFDAYLRKRSEAFRSLRHRRRLQALRRREAAQRRRRQLPQVPGYQSALG
jgi:beta-phosphoglucomutase-like phosphatase (HAD superfamily)